MSRLAASGSAQRRVSAALGEARRRAASAPYMAYFAILVIVAFLADPMSFTRSWNEGRSAMLAIVPLVFLEAGKRSLAPLESGRKSLMAWLTLGAAAVYYFVFAQPSVFDPWSRPGRVWASTRPSCSSAGSGASTTPSLLLFLISLLLLDRESKTITPLIYTVGMASFLFIDVLLPENTLGPFGYVVPPVLRWWPGRSTSSAPGQPTPRGTS